MIVSKGDKSMVENTTDINFDLRIKDSYNSHRSIFILCFYKYMRIFSPPTYHMHSKIGFNIRKEFIVSFKSMGAIE